MAFPELRPTEEQLRYHLDAILRHSMRVEYVFAHPSISIKDPDGVHDLEGKGNKYEWPILCGLSLQKRERDPEHYKRYVEPAVEAHRKQRHHVLWNKPNGTATEQDLLAGAIDTVCSLLEDRWYLGGSHTYDQIEKMDEYDAPHKAKWIRIMVGRMRRIEQPVLDLVNIENVKLAGIPQEICQRVVKRVDETLSMLQHEQGYDLSKILDPTTVARNAA